MQDTMLGPYRLMEPLSQGPAGEVHLAWDTRLNQRVLVRRIPRLDRTDEDDEAFRAFLDVMRRLSALSHPGILAPTDFSSPATGEAFYVTEHSEGVSLRVLMDKGGRLGWRAAAMIVHEAAVALAFAHQRKVAHGHIGSSRVLVERAGRVVLGPFDVMARVLLREGAREQVNLPDIYDDLAYVAPEQLQRHAPSLPGDVFSLGVVAFELLSGQRPFPSVPAILGHAQARRSGPDPGETVTGLPAALRELLQEMLSGRPEQRPPDAAAVRERLADVLREVGASDVRPALRKELEAFRAVFGVEPEPEPAAEAPAKAKKAARKRQGDGARKGGETAGPPPGAAPRGDKGKQRPGPAQVVAQLQIEPAARSEVPERSESRVAVGLMVALVVGLVALWWFAMRDDGPVAPTPAPVVASAPPGGTGPARGLAVAPVAAGEAEAPEGSLTTPLASDDPVEVRLAKARILLAQGDGERAESLAQAGLDAAGGPDRELLMLLGAARARQGKLDAAVQAWTDADATDTAANEGHLQAGLALAESGRCPEALAMFTEGQRRGNRSAELLKYVGNCQLLTGDAEGAAETLDRARVELPDDLDVVVPLGQALEKAGQLTAAGAQYAYALSIDPDNERARAGVMRIEARTGRQIAIPVRRRAAGAEGGEEEPEAPKDAAAGKRERMEAEAQLAFTSGRYGKAIQVYRDLIEELGADAGPALLRNYAVTLERAGEDREAIQAYRRAIAADPGDAELSYLLGRLLVRAGRVPEGASELARAVELDPERWQALFDLGTTLLEGGRPEDAAQAFARVVALRPRDEAALQNLAKAQVDAGMSDAAVMTFQRLADLDPNDPRPVMNAAALMQRMGREADMQRLLAEACRRGASEACP